ncbi:MAG: hypothetical protein LRY39_01295 [Alphaproteobacteria bacterium]|nr:hypothetical protein [Alphaproteobacteria bacterium]MCD8570849.1 hypothetical protein [Alphaproteobacteria bacterium]
MTDQPKQPRNDDSKSPLGTQSLKEKEALSKSNERWREAVRQMSKVMLSDLFRVPSSSEDSKESGITITIIPAKGAHTPGGMD